MTAVVRLLVFAAFAGVTPLGATPASAGPPATYSAEAIHGRVVDAETKQPLEGVHVVAQWILNSGIFIHAERITRLQILETVTDAKGEYRLPAWGPKPRPALSVLEWGFDPIVTYFKPGYEPLSRSNFSPPPSDEESMSTRIFRWTGRSVELTPFRRSLDDWVRALQTIQIRLGWGHTKEGPGYRPNDHWRYAPRMVLALLEERRRLPENARQRLLDVDSWQISESDLQALVRGKGLVP